MWDLGTGLATGLPFEVDNLVKRSAFSHNATLFAYTNSHTMYVLDIANRQ